MDHWEPKEPTAYDLCIALEAKEQQSWSHGNIYLKWYRNKFENKMIGIYFRKKCITGKLMPLNNWFLIIVVIKIIHYLVNISIFESMFNMLLVLPISCWVISLALGQSCDCPNASKVTMADMAEWNTTGSKWFNSLWPEWHIYASVNFPSLVQIMAYRLVGAKPLSKPMLEYCYLTIRNKLQWNLNQK